jgi:hypothetical protein
MPRARISQLWPFSIENRPFQAQIANDRAKARVDNFDKLVHRVDTLAAIEARL